MGLIFTLLNISLHYLEQLFRKLRNGQAVKSVRGPGGGYVLARAMDEITVKDILDCVGENINPAKDILGTEAETSNTVEFHLSKNYFQNLGFIMTEYLSTTSLGDLIRKSNEVTADVERVNAERAQAAQTETQNVASTTTESAFSEFASGIRTSIGEINQ